MEYCIIFKDCSEFLPSQELLEGYPIDKVPLAVYVPMNPESAVPEGAFAGVPRLRHVSVESDIRLRLRSMALMPSAPNCPPSTVVSISDNAFRSCKLLNSVTAPGCREFGYKDFDECCSLQWVYTTEGIANRFGSSTKFGHYLFRGCINLAEFTLQESPSPSEPAVATHCQGIGPRLPQLYRDVYTNANAVL